MSISCKQKPKSAPDYYNAAGEIFAKKVFSFFDDQDIFVEMERQIDPEPFTPSSLDDFFYKAAQLSDYWKYPSQRNAVNLFESKMMKNLLSLVGDEKEHASFMRSNFKESFWSQAEQLVKQNQSVFEQVYAEKQNAFLQDVKSHIERIFSNEKRLDRAMRISAKNAWASFGKDPDQVNDDIEQLLDFMGELYYEDILDYDEKYFDIIDKHYAIHNPVGGINTSKVTFEENEEVDEDDKPTGSPSSETNNKIKEIVKDFFKTKYRRQALKAFSSQSALTR